VKAHAIIPYGVTLPLLAFVLHPLTTLGLAVLHTYLAVGHLRKLSLGSMHWTDMWKGFGALAAAYVFAALASRGLARAQKPAVRAL
jgi:hypothetical protein